MLPTEECNHPYARLHWVGAIVHCNACSKTMGKNIVCSGIKREGESCSKNNNCTYPKCQKMYSREEVIRKGRDLLDKLEIEEDDVQEYWNEWIKENL